jgi:hypothetical protein
MNIFKAVFGNAKFPSHLPQLDLRFSMPDVAQFHEKHHVYGTSGICPASWDFHPKPSVMGQRDFCVVLHESERNGLSLKRTE